MKCPKCGSENTRYCETLESGSVRYYCRDCKKKWTPNRKRSGTKYLLGRKLTNAEKQKRFQAKKRRSK